MVGINEIKLLYEPLAAVVAYDLDRKTNSERVLVFNFGGSSIEVSIVDIENGEMDIVSNAADINFGGNKFNERLKDYFIQNYMDLN
jgi:molecular chaperone DnaK (HSP70)